MRRRAFIAALAVLVLSLPLLAPACGGGGEKVTEVVLGSQHLQDAFALYYPVPASSAPRVPAYTVAPDLSDVAGARAAGLPADAARALAAQGFIAVAGSGDTIYEAYEDIAAAKFVSVDALMYTIGRLGAHVLGDVERRFLVADLGGLIGSLHETTSRMFEASDGAVREAALANLACLGVASRLLGMDVAVPGEVADTVERELSLVAGASGTSPSPLSGYARDYGRYAARGHYRDGGALESYFQAMSWLGDTGFYPLPGSGPGDITAGRGMARQALLLVAALHAAEVDGEPAYEVWDRIYQTTSFLSAGSNDLDAYTVTRLAWEMLGDSFPLGRLGDDGLVDELSRRALEERKPRIATLAGEGAEVAESSVAFRLFPRPGYADDLVFEELVMPRVAERFMPRCLDLPAALGSDRALQVLDQYYGESGFEGYEESMNGLRGTLRGIDPAQFHSDLYWGRLDVLRLLLKPSGEGYPSFMRSTAWEDRGLYAFLAAWADMRSGGDLSSAGSGGEERPAQAEAKQGYVEPNPEAFARLAAMADMMRRGLEARGLLSVPARERLDVLYELLLGLRTMAEKELRGEDLSAGEYAAIADIGNTMRYLATFPEGGEGEGGLWDGDAHATVTGALFRDEDFGEVLQAAVGRPLTYYVIAPVGGRPTLTVGAGYSYYEFVRPADSPLDSEEWREMVEAGQLPERSAWPSSFLR